MGETCISSAFCRYFILHGCKRIADVCKITTFQEIIFLKIVQNIRFLPGHDMCKIRNDFRLDLKK